MAAEYKLEIVFSPDNGRFCSWWTNLHEALEYTRACGKVEEIKITQVPRAEPPGPELPGRVSGGLQNLIHQISGTEAGVQSNLSNPFGEQISETKPTLPTLSDLRRARKLAEVKYLLAKAGFLVTASDLSLQLLRESLWDLAAALEAEANAP